MVLRRLLQIVVAVVVTAAAVRLAPMVFAFTQADTSFTGSYSVGGGGTKLIYCSQSATAVSLPAPAKGAGSTTASATFTCYNNTAAAVSLTINILNSAMSATGNKVPTYQWLNGTTPSTSMIIGGGSSASRTVTFTRDNNDDNGPFTFTWGVSGTTSPSVLEYVRSGYSITIN